MLPAVPTQSSGPFRPIQSPLHQSGSNNNNMISTTTTTPTTYHHPNPLKASQQILRHVHNAGNKHLAEGNHNYVNFSSEMPPQPAYANISIPPGPSRPNSTTSFAEIQQAKQKQQQIEQQRRRESTGSGRFLVENTTSSRLVSNAMSEMMQNNLSNSNVSQARARSSSQASLASSSTTGK